MVLASAHIKNYLVVTLLGLPDNSRHQRRLPNDLPYRFLL
jgi:hypothetical protein